MPYNGFSTHLRKSPTRKVIISQGRRQMARAAHSLGPKDRKNVGGELREQLVEFSSGAVDCYAAAEKLTQIQDQNATNAQIDRPYQIRKRRTHS